MEELQTNTMRTNWNIRGINEIFPYSVDARKGREIDIPQSWKVLDPHSQELYLRQFPVIVSPEESKNSPNLDMRISVDDRQIFLGMHPGMLGRFHRSSGVTPASNTRIFPAFDEESLSISTQSQSIFFCYLLVIFGCS